jgi:hypothetical protein
MICGILRAGVYLSGEYSLSPLRNLTMRQRVLATLGRDVIKGSLPKVPPRRRF